MDALVDLLEGNRAHAESLPRDHFAAVQEEQRPSVVSVCCSDSRVSQEGMWDVTEPGRLFTPSNIGNRAWRERDGDRVVDGNLLYPVVATGTETVAVVGHTGCGAVTAAYRLATGEELGLPEAVAAEVRPLVPVVREALDAGVADDADEETAINRLVEYNVDAQVSFLRDADDLPAEAAVYGFVYDFQRVYGDVPGRTYLVNHRGDTDPEVVADRLPAEYREFVARLRTP